MLAAIGWQRRAVPDVCLIGRHTKRALQLADALDAMRHPAVGSDGAIHQRDEAAPPCIEAPLRLRRPGKPHRAGERLSIVRKRLSQYRFAPRDDRRDFLPVALTHPERAALEGPQMEITHGSDSPRSGYAC